MLKNYIIYAKRYVKPRLNDIDIDKITNFYAKIRQQSSVAGGIAIAARHLESVIRMSEAHAKLYLRDYVTHSDIDFAIDMLLESFLQTQKLSVGRQLSNKLQSFKLQKSDMNSLLYHILDKQATQNAAFIKQ
jgi:DNA replication licensing factor MCM2